MWILRWLPFALVACGHVTPASTEGVPPPWPPTDPPRVERATPTPPAPAGTPVVPPLKRLDKNPP